jgi:hypothetical protein
MNRVSASAVPTAGLASYACSGSGEDLDVPALELGAKRPEVVLLEVVLDGERLQGALVDVAALLGVFEERVERCFEHGDQCCSTPLSA